MKRQDFYFDLPPELIAQYPLPKRTDSRLLVYDRASGKQHHQLFSNVIDFLEPGDLLVMNNSRVIAARLFGQKESGGKVELLIERILGETQFLAHIKASKSPKPNTWIHLANNWGLRVLKKEQDLYWCEANGIVESMLAEIGSIPLPPYITRAQENADLERYQTVYATEKGSVAAPTAGLHFDEDLLQALKAKSIRVEYTTLHVGSGTFKPVRCEAIQEHLMHAERYWISPQLCEAIATTKQANKRVIAVGTTALRSLESAAQQGGLTPGEGETTIFIYPGYRFKICDGLITNFHLPESTLLMLVSAFIGYQETMALYHTAIKNSYRFFSYGDASLLL